VQHGGGVQPHDAGGVGGVQHVPAKAAAGTAAIISQRPMPAISAIKWVLLAIGRLSWSIAQVCKQETRPVSRFGAYPAWPDASCNPRATARLTGKVAAEGLKDDRRCSI
jgi:hypothetical protein